MSKYFLFIGGPNDGERLQVRYDADVVTVPRDSIEGPLVATYYRKEMTSRDHTFTVFTAEKDMRSFEIVRALINGYHNPPRG